MAPQPFGVGLPPITSWVRPKETNSSIRLVGGPRTIHHLRPLSSPGPRRALPVAAPGERRATFRCGTSLGPGARGVANGA